MLRPLARRMRLGRAMRGVGRAARRDFGELGGGQRDDLDAPVFERPVGQYRRVGAHRFAHEAQRVAARRTNEFANVQAVPPMTLTTLIVRVSGTSA
ncbi:Uncharacterised protein [Burkholderia mallei]|uniref:hypothetical protein n=1 Tax=Burkholderia pseudomallei TaxID=28450 RepID=UPI0004F706CF|nr:hypothetical protein DM55_886 [Burkholderia mallei]AJX42128.1 hypothetical protein BG99_302 [Burkholderia mallei]AJY33521.1 hypothetical protein BO07_3061 [Burkholderia mallei]SQA66672.1 Uncharacterised protein [Burkholderia mallei]